MKQKESGDAKFSTKTTPKAAPALMELFVDSIKDIYWAENHLVKSLPKMQKAATSNELSTAIGEHLEETKIHVTRLEQIFELLGEKAQAKKCDAMEGLSKEGEGIIESTEGGTATRDVGIILASQKVEHYEIATYGGIHQLAITLGLNEVADILAETLAEEKAADQKLTDVAENSVNYTAAEQAEQISRKKKNTPPKLGTETAIDKHLASQPENDKTTKLAEHTADATDELMTTNTGLKINDDQNSLKAGERGATLLEDFVLREKITHFDHERIPERVVHARGSGAHGVFKVYESLASVTKAKFLLDPAVETPVFVRFSTVAGSKGSTDLARDVRGFAVRFYTQEGNFDLVGNNMPVFFIQDALKFPDLVHAVKPEPDNEIPQAASAHDTFWDFISLMPESAHMIMWLMSDRALPRSYRMMEGFGVHTFRLIDAAGKSNFVKFHWKPLLGVHSVAWDEAQNISGKDPDFHRRDLWDAIESGAFPEWELGIQVVPEEDEFKFEFDLLDPTKIIPEELVPVQRIGKMTLNRNPDNFFAETEQIAFHLGNIVPGIDFTNDPLLQGRLFSYTDTQLLRLGGPNFHEIPINRPVVPIHNNQRDGLMRQTINKGKVSYSPNSLGNNDPAQVKEADGGFVSYGERIEARKIRTRSKSFFDHFSQARLFLNSQSDPEKNHLVDALTFELGKVKTVAIRERMLGILQQIDKGLAAEVAFGLRIHLPEKEDLPTNQSIPADANPQDYQSVQVEGSLAKSSALSMAGTIKDTIKSRKVAILAADGVDAKSLKVIKDALEAEGAIAEVIAPRLNYIIGDNDEKIPVDQSFLTAASVLFDAVYVAGGTNSVATLEADADAVHFLNEAFKHCKAVAADSQAMQVLEATYFIKKLPADYSDESVLKEGIVIGSDASKVGKQFILAIAQHRFWEREKPRKIPA